MEPERIQEIKEQVLQFYQKGILDYYISCSQFTAIDEDFEDLKQDAFLYILEHIEKYKPTRGNLKTFCMLLLRNFFSMKKYKRQKFIEGMREFANLSAVEKQLRENNNPLELFESKKIIEFKVKEVISMRDSMRDLLFDFIVNNWTADEKNKFKEYVKKDIFEPDDLYPCFGFFYWNDKECQKCVFRRLCALSVKEVWIPYVLDYIKEYLNQEEKRLLLPEIIDAFGNMININVPKQKSIDKNDYGLKKYGFNTALKLGRGAVLLLEKPTFKEAADVLAKEFGITLEDAMVYLKRQTFFYLRKRGFKVHHDKATDKIEIIFPEDKNEA